MEQTNKIPLSFYKWIHSRIYKQTLRGMISREQILIALGMHFNIPKRMKPLIIKELEILSLIKLEDGIFVVKESEEEEVIRNMEKKLLH